MRKSKKMVSIMLAMVCIFSVTSTSFAFSNSDVIKLSEVPPSKSYLKDNEVNILSETPPSESSSGDIVLYGSKPPSKNASVHNLSRSAYSYEAVDMGYRLYTNKWLTGSTSLSIDVYGWELLNYHGGTGNKLTLRVYDSSDKQVASKTITIDNWDSVGSGYAYFSGLSSSSKYYVCFEVPTNGNRYTYRGKIS